MEEEISKLYENPSNSQKNLDDIQKLPVVGLPYMLEISNDDRSTETICLLCDKKLMTNTFLSHLKSVQHMKRFASKQVPELSATYGDLNPEDSTSLISFIKELKDYEKKNGRGRIASCSERDKAKAMQAIQNMNPDDVLAVCQKFKVHLRGDENSSDDEDSLVFSDDYNCFRRSTSSNAAMMNTDNLISRSKENLVVVDSVNEDITLSKFGKTFASCGEILGMNRIEGDRVLIEYSETTSCVRASSEFRNFNFENEMISVKKFNPDELKFISISRYSIAVSPIIDDFKIENYLDLFLSRNVVGINLMIDEEQVVINFLEQEAAKNAILELSGQFVEGTKIMAKMLGTLDKSPRKMNTNNLYDCPASSKGDTEVHLYISSFPIDWTTEDFNRTFSKYGTIKNLVMAKSRKCAFLYFENEECCAVAKEELNGSNIGGGRGLKVEFSNSQGTKNKPREIAETSTLFVSNIPVAWSESYLATLFEKYGKIESTFYMTGKRSAFINYFDVESSRTAMQKLVDDSSGIKVQFSTAASKNGKRAPKETSDEENPVIFVTYTPLDWHTENDIFFAFKKFGKIENISFITHKRTAIVAFKTAGAAHRAVKGMSNTVFGNETMLVKFADPTKLKGFSEPFVPPMNLNSDGPDSTVQRKFSIMVTNCPASWSDQTLFDTFKQFGMIKSVKLISSKHTGFVNYQSMESCERAIGEKNNSSTEEGVLRVKFQDSRASERESRPSYRNKDEQVPSLLVSALPRDSTEQTLFQEFKKFGRISSVKMLKNANAFVNFEDVHSCRLAIEALHGKKVVQDGPRLSVKFQFAFSDQLSQQSPEIQVCDLPCDFREKDVFLLFKEFGHIINVTLGPERGSALVLFDTPRSANLAKSNVHGKWINNTKISIREHKKVPLLDNNSGLRGNSFRSQQSSQNNLYDQPQPPPPPPPPPQPHYGNFYDNDRFGEKANNFGSYYGEPQMPSHANGNAFKGYGERPYHAEPQPQSFNQPCPVFIANVPMNVDKDKLEIIFESNEGFLNYKQNKSMETIYMVNYKTNEQAQVAVRNFEGRYFDGHTLSATLNLPSHIALSSFEDRGGGAGIGAGARSLMTSRNPLINDVLRTGLSYKEAERWITKKLTDKLNTMLQDLESHPEYELEYARFKHNYTSAQKPGESINIQSFITEWNVYFAHEVTKGNKKELREARSELMRVFGESASSTSNVPSFGSSSFKRSPSPSPSGYYGENHNKMMRTDYNPSVRW